MEAIVVEGNFFGEINLLTGWPATHRHIPFTPYVSIAGMVDLYGVLSEIQNWDMIT